MGLSEEQFWRLTPFQWYLYNQAEIEKIKMQNIITLRQYNVVKNMFSSDVDIETWEDILGIEEEVKWKTPDEFDSWEEYKRYINEEYKPWAKARGLLDGE